MRAVRERNCDRNREPGKGREGDPVPSVNYIPPLTTITSPQSVTLCFSLPDCFSRSCSPLE